jgi:hypothetical protein
MQTNKNIQYKQLNITPMLKMVFSLMLTIHKALAQMQKKNAIR